jgi:hypothetical protein
MTCIWIAPGSFRAVPRKVALVMVGWLVGSHFTSIGLRESRNERGAAQENSTIEYIYDIHHCVYICFHIQEREVYLERRRIII